MKSFLKIYRWHKTYKFTTSFAFLNMVNGIVYGQLYYCEKYVRSKCSSSNGKFKLAIVTVIILTDRHYTDVFNFIHCRNAHVFFNAHPLPPQLRAPSTLQENYTRGLWRQWEEQTILSCSSVYYILSLSLNYTPKTNEILFDIPPMWFFSYL